MNSSLIRNVFLTAVSSAGWLASVAEVGGGGGRGPHDDDDDKPWNARRGEFN